VPEQPTIDSVLAAMTFSIRKIEVLKSLAAMSHKEHYLTLKKTE
jgi:hypothetical protein